MCIRDSGEGVIIAKRHIHMTPADAAAAGVADKDIVKVVTGGNGRKLVFDDVEMCIRDRSWDMTSGTQHLH